MISRASRLLAFADGPRRAAVHEQLLRSQKMEAVARFAGGVAHGFNNLLSIILSYSELLDSELPPGDPAHADLEQIRMAGERAAALTRQLIVFSGKQARDAHPLDLNAVVANMGGALARILGGDVELKTVLGPELGKINADPKQIEQVLMNLAINAREAMPTGGELKIETMNVEFDEAYAKDHPGVTAGSYVMLAVSDTGTGMNEATCALAFEPFFTPTDVGKGWGLGLSAVFGIVKQSGGTIWLFSEAGRGTIFEIYLPREGGEAT